MNFNEKRFVLIDHDPEGFCFCLLLGMLKCLVQGGTLQILNMEHFTKSMRI